MKIIIDTSVLISGSIMWKYSEQNTSVLLKHKFFTKCDTLLSFLKQYNNLEIGVITKTVEIEAKNVLQNAVLTTLKESWYKIPNVIKAKKIMTLQYIILTESLDRLENIIEECSIRLPIDIQRRENIKKKEIEPFLRELVSKTVRYRQPHIPNVIKGDNLRGELTDIILKDSKVKQIVYKGMPEEKDLTIMAEATFIYRKYNGKEEIYIASMDNNFKPNPVQIGSYMAAYNKYTGELDSTVRDKLAEKFGFIGEEPDKLMKIIKTKQFPTSSSSDKTN